MSKYTYAGDFVNPTDTWRVASTPDATKPEGYAYFIECHHRETREIDGVVGTFEYWAPHTGGYTFDTAEEANEFVDQVQEDFEEDYENYLEENHDAIVQMERYEMWRNEC